MSFVSKDLSLPLFLRSRNTFRNENSNVIQKEILKSKQRYFKNCKSAKPEASKLAECAGIDLSFKKPCTFKQRCTFGSRDATARKVTTTVLHNLLKIPYITFKGDIGSYWAKIPVKNKIILDKLRSKKKTESIAIPKTPESTQTAVKRCNQFKGTLPGNARERLATTRSMISDPTLCYRDPNYPGPTDYYPKNFEFSHNLAKVVKTKSVTSYIFLDKSSVPSSRTNVTGKNVALSPSPIHYDTRFKKRNHKPKALKYSPDIAWDVDRENRAKFRQKTYKKINISKHYSPEFDHVKGNGMTFLFKNIPKKKEYKGQKHKKITDEKQIQLFASGKYIHMINHPTRKMISRWDDESLIRIRPFNVKYNTLIKKTNKRVRHDKNVVFLSGCERWKDAQRPRQLTPDQLKDLTMKLPAAQQIVNLPVSTRDIKNIEGRLFEIPSRFKSDFEAKRKIKFKFTKVPGEEHVTISEDFEEYMEKVDKHHVFIEHFIKDDEETRIKLNALVKKISKENEHLNLFTGLMAKQSTENAEIIK